jgi:2-oxoisovalerate dehydrogenase E1 component beta subunit
VIFFEPKRIYRSIKEQVPKEEYAIPFGKGEIARKGKDLTLIGWGAQHHQNLEAAKLAEQEGIDVEVINLRTLNPLDETLIFSSVQKTGRAVIADEAPKCGGFAGEIAARIQKECFLFLEAPILRCCGLDTPFPHTLERYYLPDAKRVFGAIVETVGF